MSALLLTVLLVYASGTLFAQNAGWQPSPGHPGADMAGFASGRAIWAAL